MGDDELTRVRREQVGFVFQFFNLLPTLTVGDNIALPCLLAGVSDQEAEARARALAERVGIAHRLSHYPQQISGGEMQRAAIARALIHQPALLVADEPTGNLDSENGANVLALIAELNTRAGRHVLLATHAADVAPRRRECCDEGWGRRHPGRFASDEAVPSVHPPAAASARRSAPSRRCSASSLGIAVVIAIQLTNASSVRGFETALETVAGKTAVEIIGTGTGVDESLLPQLAGCASSASSPGHRRQRGAGRRRRRRRCRGAQMEAVKVLGVDILRDQPFRDYQLLRVERPAQATSQGSSRRRAISIRSSSSRS